MLKKQKISTEVKKVHLTYLTPFFKACRNRHVVQHALWLQYVCYTD